MDFVERHLAWFELRQVLVTRLDQQAFITWLDSIQEPLNAWLTERRLPNPVMAYDAAPQPITQRRAIRLAARLEQGSFEPEVNDAIGLFLKLILDEPRSEVVGWVRRERAAGRLLTMAEVDRPATRERCETELKTEVTRRELRAAFIHISTPRFKKVTPQNP